MQYTATVTLTYRDKRGIYEETNYVSFVASDIDTAEDMISKRISSAVSTGKIISGNINSISGKQS